MIDADVLPLPKTIRGWLLSVLIIATCFAIFYPFLFPQLETSYRTNFWTKAEPNEQTIGSIPIKITFQIPKYISSFSATEFIVSVSNNASMTNGTCEEIKPADNNTTSGTATDPKSCDYNTTGNLEMILMLEDENAQQLIYHLENSNEELIQDGENRLAIGRVPPGVTITKRIWIRLNNKSATNIDYNLVLVEKDEFGIISRAPIPIPINKPTDSAIDPFFSFIQALIGSILLPPLSNGIIVLLSLFAVYSIESYEYVPLLPPANGKERFSKLRESWKSDIPFPQKIKVIIDQFGKLLSDAIAPKIFFLGDKLGILITALIRSVGVICVSAGILLMFMNFEYSSSQFVNFMHWLLAIGTLLLITIIIYTFPIKARSRIDNIIEFSKKNGPDVLPIKISTPKPPIHADSDAIQGETLSTSPISPNDTPPQNTE